MNRSAQILDRLEYYFNLLNIDAKKLNNDTGISLRQCYKIINKKHLPSLNTFIKIVNTYEEISLRYLFSDT
jgi:predicted transcriptional regulator